MSVQGEVYRILLALAVVAAAFQIKVANACASMEYAAEPCTTCRSKAHVGGIHIEAPHSSLSFTAKPTFNNLESAFDRGKWR